MAQRPTMEELSAYLSGDMEGSARVEIETLLKSDPDVVADLQRLERGLSFLKTHGAVAPPSSLEQEILRAVALEDGPAHRQPWRIAPIGATLLAAAAALLFITLPESSQNPAQLEKMEEAEEEAPDAADMVANKISRGSDEFGKVDALEEKRALPKARSAPQAKPAAAPPPSHEAKVPTSIGNLLADKEGSTGNGGLGSRGSGIGGGAAAERLGGLGSKGSGVGRSGYGSGAGSIGSATSVRPEANILAPAEDEAAPAYDRDFLILIANYSPVWGDQIEKASSRYSGLIRLELVTSSEQADSLISSLQKFGVKAPITQEPDKAKTKTRLVTYVDPAWNQ